MSTPFPPGSNPGDPYQPPAGAGVPPQQGAPQPFQQPGPYQAGPYQPGPYQPAMGFGMPPMQPQRNTIVFVVSILLIIGGAINLISGLGLIGIISNYDRYALDTYFTTGIEPASQGVLVVQMLFSILAGVYGLYVGITGVQNASKPEKGDFLFKLGIGLVAMNLISMIIGFVASGAAAMFGVIGFLLPVLFVVGANQLKSQAQARPPQAF